MPEEGGGELERTKESAGELVRAEPAGLATYAGASAVASLAMVVLVLGLGLPAGGVVLTGSFFLAVAATMRRLQDLDSRELPPVLAAVVDHLEELGDRWGLEFYGIASLTAFLRAEARSLLDSGVTLAEFLASPLSAAIRWLVAEFVESIMNAVWAPLWWLQLFQAVSGLEVFIAVVAAGWAVWWLLDRE